MKTSLYLVIITATNILVAFLLQWYVLVIIGPGVATDALFAGMAVPQLVLAVISGSLMHVLVPLLAAEKEENFRKDAWGFFLLIGGFFTVVASVLYWLAPYWVQYLVPGFSETGKLLVIDLTRIQLIGMVFTALAGVQSAVYHARQRFVWAEVTPLLGSIVAFGILAWGLPKYGIVAAAWGNVARVVLQTLFLLRGLGRYHKTDWNNAALKNAWSRIKPLLLGTTYYKLGPVVDRYLSSMVPPGGLTLYYLGNQIYGAAGQVINNSIAAPMVPLLASYAKAGNWSQFRMVYRKRLLWMTCLTGVGFLFFIFAGVPLLELLVGHGGVTEQNVTLLWSIMLALVGVFVGGAMGQILSTAFYAKGNTVTPTKVGVFGFTLGIAFKVIGFYQFGLLGIALGTTLYYFLNAFLLYILLERRIQRVISTRD